MLAGSGEIVERAEAPFGGALLNLIIGLTVAVLVMAAAVGPRPDPSEREYA
jgi:hypothetical protein